LLSQIRIKAYTLVFTGFCCASRANREACKTFIWYRKPPNFSAAPAPLVRAEVIEPVPGIALGPALAIMVQYIFSTPHFFGITKRLFMVLNEFIKRTALLILMGSSGGLLFTSCADKKEEKEEQIKLLVTSPLQKDTTITKEYVAQIHSYQHIELRALEKGYLQKIFVDEGQLVHEGQPMFQITPLIYNADLQKSQAEANYVGIEYRTTKSLADSNIVSKNELALAKAKFDKAKADVSLAKTHLQFTSINAPFTGIMDHFQGRLGSLVDEGDLLTTLSDNSKMWVYYNVPEAEYLAYKETAKAGDGEVSVRLKMANNEVFPFPGKVQAIEADFNNETGNIAFRATFPNPKGLLRNGETGSVLMTVPWLRKCPSSMYLRTVSRPPTKFCSKAFAR
jgi:membrane fusion protein (multidrug efflux system)